MLDEILRKDKLLLRDKKLLNLGLSNNYLKGGGL